MSFKFGLNVKNKLASGPAKPGLAKKKKSLLGGDDDEDVKGKAKASSNVQEISDFNFDDTLAASSSSQPTPAPTKPKKGQPPAPPTKKAKAKDDDPTTIGYSASAKEAERLAEEAGAQDASLYDYDSAYDALHARQAALAAAAKEDAAARKPKYIDALFSASEQRKKDQLRARDKLLAREREAEGDEFADKEKFVTGAYKQQQEDAARAEEEERLRLEAEEEQKKKHGMQGFHKQMLLEQEARHAEAMRYAAEAKAKGEALPALEQEKSDRQIADEARAQGKEVLLNDAGEIADRRQLLSAGLNIVAKPKPKTAAGGAAADEVKPVVNPLTYQPKAAKHAQRERQTAMIAEQIEAAQKRKADEEAEEHARLVHAAKSQKTAGEISSAKERYLQRKKEAAEAKAKAAAAGK